ncbi:TetR/AcrR family transcriptional regulator [Salipaludibacillus sp. CUR1]|uniref:TetR/AcrR family transcriptional regulator n=1 Tax=Salipaludibacillus sp. CUR1 TaxID=2820003 RepID=UPI001E4BA50B|nr:TetR/AcrR family transcriptional regulator [Salipaludibacillus sp. CUR1]MCE7792329.1 TetR/AcrR family transcriptional regulator [Salipaludibacillus sp. CUR1]
MKDAKERHDRKQEFLDTALDLFYEKGYEKTTIKDIINQVGLSKGAFYHYFESKEDVIEQISEAFAEETIYSVKKLSERTDINAVEKINRSIELIQQHKKQFKDKRKKIKGAFNSEENLKLQKKILDRLKGRILPYYKRMLDEGVTDNLFDIPDSTELAEFFLLTFDNLSKSIEALESAMLDRKTMDEQEFKTALENKLAFYQEVIERVFKVEKDTFNVRDPFMNRFS